MKIKWWGHACFAITAQNGKVLLTDPYPPSIGYLPIADSVDIVTISHDHFDHNAVDGLRGEAKIIKEAGRHLVDGFEITGIESLHDDAGGSKRGKNLIFSIMVDGLRIVHLGDQGITLTPGQLEQIGQADIVMIPVGGTYTVDAAQACQIVQQLNPKVVLPMHYQTEALTFNIAPVSEFTKLFAPGQVQTVDSAELQLDTLPAEQKVYVLQYVNQAAV